MSGKVLSVNVSREKGTIKSAVPEITLDSTGVVGDAHRGHWHRQVSLLAQEHIHDFAAQLERTVAPGEFAENITTEGVELGKAAPLDRISIGSVELEITQIGKKCHGDGCAIFQEVGACVMPKQGIFARVLSGGAVEAGMALVLTPHTFSVEVITLSDRVVAGVYPDRSGPRIAERLEAELRPTLWHLDITQTIMPDDPEGLQARLEVLRDKKTDLIITTGGTGIGPRDYTPGVVTGLCDCLIPGVMEYIRNSCGAENPKALLSRSVAGVMGSSLVYALPGSYRAVNEYLDVIVPTLEHTVFMLHGIDRQHG